MQTQRIIRGHAEPSFTKHLEACSAFCAVNSTPFCSLGGPYDAQTRWRVNVSAVRVQYFLCQPKLLTCLDQTISCSKWRRGIPSKTTPTSMVLNGGSTSLSNSQSTILHRQCERKRKSTRGHVEHRFQPAFAGRKGVWLGTTTLTGQSSNWQALGVWQVLGN